MSLVPREATMDRKQRDDGDDDEVPEFPYGRCESCDAELTDEAPGDLCPTCGAHRK